MYSPVVCALCALSVAVHSMSRADPPAVAPRTAVYRSVVDLVATTPALSNIDHLGSSVQEHAPGTSIARHALPPINREDEAKFNERRQLARANAQSEGHVVDSVMQDSHYIALGMPAAQPSASAARILDVAIARQILADRDATRQLKDCAESFVEDMWCAGDPEHRTQIELIDDSILEAASDMRIKPCLQGRDFLIYCFDGKASMHQQVLAVLQEPKYGWEAHCGARFRFTTSRDEADVRLTFQQQGYWSIVGPAELYPGMSLSEPTMCLQFDSSSIPTAHDYFADRNAKKCIFFRRKVLHEFGHVLGFVHEHSHPDADIPWLPDAVFAKYCKGPGEKEKERVRNNWLTAKKHHQVLHNDYDPDSVMHYPIDPQLLTKAWIIEDHVAKSDISAKDAEHARRMYGPPALAASSSSSSSAPSSAQSSAPTPSSAS